MDFYTLFVADIIKEKQLMQVLTVEKNVFFWAHIFSIILIIKKNVLIFTSFVMVYCDLQMSGRPPHHPRDIHRTDSPCSLIYFQTLLKCFYSTSYQLSPHFRWKFSLEKNIALFSVFSWFSHSKSIFIMAVKTNPSHKNSRKCEQYGHYSPTRKTILNL